MATVAQQFSATVEKVDGARLGVRLPFVPADIWGDRTRYHITGTIDGKIVRGELQRAREDWTLILGPAWRRDNHVNSGDTVAVSLTLEGPQEATVAPDIAAALSASAQAVAFFDGLPTFYRKNFMRWIESAKRPETRAARIAEMVGLLERGIRAR